MNKHTNHLFFSAHYDDVIGSCGGTISKLIKKGETVTIITVFGKVGSYPYSPFALRLHELWRIKDDALNTRMQENQKACNILGCSFSNFPFEEALYRKNTEKENLYIDKFSIFSKRHQLDDFIINKIFKFAYKKISDNELYFPIAIGNHVDHQILREVGNKLFTKGNHITFYHDFFYQDIEYENHIQSMFNYREEIISEFDFNKKIEAFKCYESQIPMLFESNESMIKWFSTNNININGDYCEKYYA